MRTSRIFRNGRSMRMGASIALVSLCALVFSGMASAQWEVTDEQTHTKLETSNEHLQKIRDDLGEKDGNVNNNLKKLYDQQLLDNSKKSDVYKDKPKDEIADLPDFDLEKDKPEGAVTEAKVDKDKRCHKDDKICPLLFDTERAKYNYSVAVYKNTTVKRIKELKEIQEQRAGLTDADQGKLQSNNNRLLTLIAKMDIDKQQQKAAMDAYDARIRYLQSANDTLSNEKSNGSTNPTAAETAASALALAAAKVMFDSIPTVR